MMKKSFGKKNLALMIVLSTLTVALAGCSGNKAEESAQSTDAALNVSAQDSTDVSDAGQEVTGEADDSSITIGIPQDLDSLDPHLATGAGTSEVLFNLFEGLVKPDENGNLNPAVASEYTISDDGSVYTFTLRDGITFHDHPF